MIVCLELEYDTPIGRDILSPAEGYTTDSSYFSNNTSKLTLELLICL